MAEDPFQPFTADPSSDGTESAAGNMGGFLTFSAGTNRALPNRGSGHSPGTRRYSPWVTYRQGGK